MIIVLDGYALGPENETNAIFQAEIPNIDKLMSDYPSTKLEASGTRVGLPKGQMGNSEVGHLNIGAGRVMNQTLLRINTAIEDGSLGKNPVITEAMDKSQGSNLHIIGLLSPGGVHSHENHIYRLLQVAKAKDLNNVYLHLIFDGRDVSPDSAIKSVDLLEERMAALRLGIVATISGRFYAMDRDNNWERIQPVYEAIMNAQAEEVSDIKDHLYDNYQEGVFDEFIKPGVVGAYKGIQEGDSIIFANFRPDRARQLTRALTEEDFDGFQRENHKNTHFVTMTDYDKSLKSVNIAFEDIIPKNTIGEIFANQGLKQLRIAETEKYAHVTFFLNGGIEEKFENEDRILIPSADVDTFDQKPEMSAVELTDTVIEQINKNEYDLIVLNYANCDMVGHTGNMEATIKAVETVDTQLGRILEALDPDESVAIIISDHGNADVMAIDEDSVVTSHSTNPVPMICYTNKKDFVLNDGGALSNVAPSLLDLLDIPKPEEMEAVSLIERSSKK